MCTVSWTRTATATELFFNRDERRQRQPARPPQRREHRGTVLLTPEDGDFGGTWIAANEHGVTLALLNRYQDAAHEGPGPFTSRGLLVLDLAAATHDRASLEEGLAATDVERFRAFTLLCLEPDGTAHRALWNGRLLTPPEPCHPPLASSGHDPHGIDVRRSDLYHQLVGAGGTPDHLFDFHRSHLPERGPLSPCMHRPDASTVSLTHVVVEDRWVTMAYAAGPPCRHALGSPISLARHERA